MGVPKFFGWLCQKNGKGVEEFIEEEFPDEVEILYLDANSLIHPECGKAASENMNLQDLEKLKIKQFVKVVNYIKFIFETIKPNILYIAIDGIAPRAKQSQQAKRRYKSFNDNIEIKKIHAKYNSKPNTNPNWNSAAITPGTKFLYELSKYIQQCMESNFFGNKGKSKIIFSSYNIPGEGEHKIFKHLKKYLKANPEKADKKYLIYGLDADLIFLSLAAFFKNLYLLREKQEISKTKEQNKNLPPKLVLVNINLVKKLIVNLMSGMGSGANPAISKDDKKKYVIDFIFICKLLGNDFLPHFAAINVGYNSMTTLISVYCIITGKGERLCKIDESGNVKINQKLFLKFLKQLANGNGENACINSINSAIEKSKSFVRCTSRNPLDIELFEHDNLLTETNKDPIKYQQPGWQSRYYKHYFNLDSKMENYQKEKNKIVKEYLRGLKWSTEYYFNDCLSWSWYYPYNHAPLLEDIADFLEKKKKKYNINKLEYDLGEPSNPFIQLLCVLPPGSFNLLPKSFQEKVQKKKYKDYFVEKFKEDLLNKSKRWMGIPDIKFPNIDLLEEKFTKCELTKTEKNILNSYKKLVIVKKK